MEEIKFDSLGLNKKCVESLSENAFVYPTKIQRLSIENALKGHDILGSAKTGSGKTLAFLVPIMEILERTAWNKEDGVGCLIITPTRELAYQIFDVLKKIGKRNDYSAGVIFGGKNLKEEAKYIGNINILIATPGRLLQHMDQTRLFECFNLKVLVIDEADKMMEMDFSECLHAILENLPADRQTLLFSATLSKSVSQLAGICLKDPLIINAHEDAKFVTPTKLNQFYCVCDLDQKMNFLFSFIKTHRKSKILIFLSCCKQVRYIFTAFCSLVPGIILMSLHGSQKQSKRLDNFEKFTNKSSCVLFATDLASRGLDFPGVDWVIQGDCPSDAQTYIHRVGRTARFNKGGNALLLLQPHELAFLKLIEQEKIPIQPIYFKEDRTTNIGPKLATFCAKDNENKKFAQQCLISYVKFVQMQSNKEIFNIQKLPLDSYSKSLGLLNIPQLNILQKKNRQTSLIEDYTNNVSDEDDDVLKGIDEPTSFKAPIKKTIEEAFIQRTKPKVITKAKMAKKLITKGIKANTKITFSTDEED